MTIRAGEEWGSPGALAEDAPVFSDDAGARSWLQTRVLDGADPAALGEIGLVGGDLHRTLGSPRHDVQDLRDGRGRRFPVDVGIAVLDGDESVFLSHLVAHPRRRPRWWAGRTVAVMNAGFVGTLDLGPRSHPNDGRLDVTDGELPFAQRRQGRRRALTGTHVPHPGLRTSRVRSADLEAGRSGGLHVWLDGVHVGHAQHLEVRCVPDALVVVA